MLVFDLSRYSEQSGIFIYEKHNVKSNLTVFSLNCVPAQASQPYNNHIKVSIVTKTFNI